jgi:hypothetical protein
VVAFLGAKLDARMGLGEPGQQGGQEEGRDGHEAAEVERAGQRLALALGGLLEVLGMGQQRAGGGEQPLPGGGQVDPPWRGGAGTG